MTIRNVSTNSSKTTLTRPRSLWARLGQGFVGVVLALIGVANITQEYGWLAAIFAVLGVGFVYLAITERTETLG